MRFLLTLAAGVLIGRNWDKIKTVVTLYAGDAGAQFDSVYAQVAQKAGQQVENLEDRIAEQRFRATQPNRNS